MTFLVDPPVITPNAASIVSHWQMFANIDGSNFFGETQENPAVRLGTGTCTVVKATNTSIRCFFDRVPLGPIDAVVITADGRTSAAATIGNVIYVNFRGNVAEALGAFFACFGGVLIIITVAGIFLSKRKAKKKAERKARESSISASDGVSATTRMSLSRD